MSRLLTFAAIVGLFSFTAAPASAQGTTAVLLDGTVLTTTGELFFTEGPIWDVDVANQTISVVGKTVTIPATVDGVEMLISGSSVTGQDGEAATGIGAANFDRLLDLNAIGRDITDTHAGPARSLFSSTEAGRTDATAPATRDAATQAIIEQNYFDYVQLCYRQHAAVLPADFLDKAGLRGADSSTWQYPGMAGGTLKSAGTVYVDGVGNEYYVPDVEVVIELSENVAGGIVRSLDLGDPLVGRPASFVIDDLLIIMNQDPRFGADVLGIGEVVINPDVFFSQGLGSAIDTIGHTVGEHVLFVQEVLTELTDPAQGLLVTAERWRFRDDANEIRFRGIVGQVGGVNLSAGILGNQFPIGLAPDLLTNTSTYSFRSRNQVNVSLVTAVDLIATIPGGGPTAAPLFNETFQRAEVEE